jgi:hypothetical protein
MTLSNDSNRSKPSPSGDALIPRLKQFLIELGKRYQVALNVIDEALHSENFKEKIWAVELILKRVLLASGNSLPEEEEGEDGGDHNNQHTLPVNRANRVPTHSELIALSDEDLIQEIRKCLPPYTT